MRAGLDKGAERLAGRINSVVVDLGEELREEMYSRNKEIERRLTNLEQLGQGGGVLRQEA